MTNAIKEIMNKVVAVAKVNDEVALKEVVDEIQALPVLVKYYAIKGFKMANVEVFYSFFQYARTTDYKEQALDLCIIILKELYVEEDDYEARNGIGKVQDFADYYNSII